jgi:hypothetical protein
MMSVKAGSRFGQKEFDFKGTKTATIAIGQSYGDMSQVGVRLNAGRIITHIP